jgi:hypothetical protein
MRIVITIAFVIQITNCFGQSRTFKLDPRLWNPKYISTINVDDNVTTVIIDKKVARIVEMNHYLDVIKDVQFKDKLIKVKDVGTKVYFDAGVYVIGYKTSSSCNVLKLNAKTQQAEVEVKELDENSEVVSMLKLGNEIIYFIEKDDKLQLIKHSVDRGFSMSGTLDVDFDSGYSIGYSENFSDTYKNHATKKIFANNGIVYLVNHDNPKYLQVSKVDINDFSFEEMKIDQSADGKILFANSFIHNDKLFLARVSKGSGELKILDMSDQKTLFENRFTSFQDMDFISSPLIEKDYENRLKKRAHSKEELAPGKLMKKLARSGFAVVVNEEKGHLKVALGAYIVTSTPGYSGPNGYGGGGSSVTVYEVGGVFTKECQPTSKKYSLEAYNLYNEVNTQYKELRMSQQFNRSDDKYYYTYVYGTYENQYLKVVSLNGYLDF